VMVGAIDVTSNQVESAEQVAAVIKEASQYVSAEQIMPCTNCGLAPMPKSVASGKLWSLAAGAALARKNL
jgi:5-methyltetrahydropteroyltriglutamate--homocysteine methyltransferase